MAEKLSCSIPKDFRVKFKKKPALAECCSLNLPEIAVCIPRSEQMFLRKLCEKSILFLRKHFLIGSESCHRELGF